VVPPECASPAGYRVLRQLPRRPVLVALAAAFTAPAAGLLSGCGRGEPDPLEALAASAREDAALIDSMLTNPAVAASLAGRIAPVAEARRQHAQALAVALGETETETSAPSTSPSALPSAPTDPASAMSRVRALLDAAHRQASNLVPTLPRRRASLVGSVAACCAAYRAVLG
jgi:hypothetical protein